MPRPMAPEDLLAMRVPEEPQISPDGALLVTSSEDGKAMLWEAATGNPVG